MDLDWICQLPVKEITAEHEGLVLCVYGPMMPQALDVMRAWGFEYKSDLFTLEKTTSTGKPAIGTGYFTRKSTEQVLYEKRGRGLKRIDCGVQHCLRTVRQVHCRKPDESYTSLALLFGSLRRVELFARR